MASHILGQDGQFRIIENAMGVPGLHMWPSMSFLQILIDVSLKIPSLLQMPFPLSKIKQVLHCNNVFYILLKQSVHSPWPDDWHRLIHAVRDSGLFESATIPDNAYALTYEPGSEFVCHWDGRGKWGEYVISSCLGYPCTITLQHAAPKSKKPVNSDKPWNYIPPQPSQEDYWTCSQTEEKVNPMKRRLWQVTMTLPPNCIYVMSGPSRYDWRHGINVNHVNHPLPRHDASNTLLFPAWNTSRNRRAVIFRSSKVFSNVCLQLDYERAILVGDVNAAEALEKRIVAAKRFSPQDEFCRKLEQHELTAYRAQAQAVLQKLESSGAHCLRFEPHQVQFEQGHAVRAVADNVVVGGNTLVEGNFGGSGQGVRLGGGGGDEGGSNRLGGGGGDGGRRRGGGGHNVNRLGDSGNRMYKGGNRLGERALPPPAATNNTPEIVVIDDSSDENEKGVPSQGRRQTADVAGICEGDDKRNWLREARRARLEPRQQGETLSTETTSVAKRATVGAAVIKQNRGDRWRARQELW